MRKYQTTYQPNSSSEIVKVEFIDGIVVDEDQTPPKSGWENVWSFFFTHGSTVGGSAYEEKFKRTTDGNWREFNGVDWLYTDEANGQANPCQCDYEAPQDHQGSVPILLE
jgi:hypothetical protein